MLTHSKAQHTDRVSRSEAERTGGRRAPSSRALRALATHARSHIHLALRIHTSSSSAL